MSLQTVLQRNKVIKVDYAETRRRESSKVKVTSMGSFNMPLPGLRLLSFTHLVLISIH